MQKFGIDKAEIPDLARVSRNQNETFISLSEPVSYFGFSHYFDLFCFVERRDRKNWYSRPG